jgi:transposase
VREALIKQQTATMNALRGLMAEFGIFAAKGHKGLGELLAIVADPDETRIPEPLRAGLVVFATMLETLEAQLRKVDKALADWARTDKSARRLCGIPGYGVVTASAIAARLPNPLAFDSGRHFAASLGLVPRQDGTGGKVKLGPISKRGDGYLRKLLVNGAMAVLRSRQAQQDPWLKKLLQTKPMKVVAVALANKNARIGWAMLIRQEDFRPRPAVAP